jgi:hypothetical protein
MLTCHFSEAEANVTNTGIPNEIPQELIPNVMRTLAMAETFRAILGVGLHVDSLYRCKAVNDAVKGSGWKPGQLPSAHMDGRAIDFIPVGLDIEQAYFTLAHSKATFDKLIIEGKGAARWIHGQVAKIPGEERQLLFMAKVDPISGDAIYTPGGKV